MKKEDRITIFLSAGELFWIAGHLGFKNLPFLGSFIRGQTPEEVRAMIQTGFESLVMRSLVRRLNPRQVEVDSMLGSLVGLVAMPEYVNLVGSLRKAEPPLQAYIFYQKGQSVSVIYKDRFFHFSLYREEAALQNSLIRWMGILGQISERVTPMQLPTSEVSDVLQKTWAQPDNVLEVVKAQGFAGDEAARLAGFLEQITLYSTLNRVGLQDGRLVKQSQLLLLGSSANLWVNHSGDVMSKTLDLKVVPAREAAILTLRFLRPEVPLPNQEDELIE